MMQISTFTKLAQELVDAASALIRQRTINIMDLDGVIVASTEKSRIGTIHAGAQKVILTKREVSIKRENVKCFPGAKEGYNMPLLCQGEMIGVIGIYGDPAEVMERGRLLQLYASKYFEIEAVMNQQLVNLELKNKLFGFLLMEKRQPIEDMKSVLSILGISFSYPVRGIRISHCCEERARGRKGWTLEVIEEQMKKYGLLDKRKDLWGMDTDSLSIIKSMNQIEPGKWVMQIKRLLGKWDIPVKISVALPVQEVQSLHETYQQVIWMDQHLEGECNLLEEPETYARYMLEKTREDNEEFLQPYLTALLEEFGEKDLQVYLTGAKLYYESGRRVGYAAEQMYIHKNTLLYRMKRLLQTLHIEEMPIFYQEYLMSLIIRQWEKHRM